MKNQQYIKAEELDWNWESDAKKRSHKLTLTHIPTGETISGELNEGKNMRIPFQERKREFYDSLLEKLEDRVFNRCPPKK